MNEVVLIETFVDTTKNNKTRFKKYYRVVRQGRNFNQFCVTVQGTEYHCHYYDNIMHDEHGNETFIHVDNGNESVLMYLIPRARKEFYSVENIAERNKIFEDAEARLQAHLNAEKLEDSPYFAPPLASSDQATFLRQIKQFSEDMHTSFKPDMEEVLDSQIEAFNRYAYGVE